MRTRVIDGSGLIVAPGFIDPHTHYDAQICWDPLITCSSWHGVTTVVMGNCGVGLAPCKPAERDVATWNLVHVEAIPYDVLNQGITWDWETFPQYMDAAAAARIGDQRGLPRGAFTLSAIGRWATRRWRARRPRRKPRKFRSLLRESDGGRRLRIFAHRDAATRRIQRTAARVPPRQS